MLSFAESPSSIDLERKNLNITDCLNVITARLLLVASYIFNFKLVDYEVFVVKIIDKDS